MPSSNVYVENVNSSKAVFGDHVVKTFWCLTTMEEDMGYLCSSSLIKERSYVNITRERTFTKKS